MLDTIPVFFSAKDPPVVSYKYSSTIRVKLFNHKQTVDQIKFKNCKLDSDGIDGACDCENSEYFYRPAGHVLTSDLGIIKDRVLRNSSLKDCPLENNKEGVDRNVLGEWEGTVLSLLKGKIPKLKGKYGTKVIFKQIFRDRVQLGYLKALQDTYVLVPADKAGNNVIIICKQYYKEVVCMELESKYELCSRYPMFQKFHNIIKSLIIGLQLPVIANSRLTKHIQCRRMQLPTCKVIF